MDSFDIIIVGGGSAGAGSRPGSPATSVLLLEAGRDYRADEAPAEMRSPNFVEIVIMPSLPRAATHLTTVMIAEHMAERLAKNS